MSTNIKMVDLLGQHQAIKAELDEAIHEVIDSSSFINGPAVTALKENLSSFLGVQHTIPCANGTDALMVALLALELEKGSEIIVPSFSFIAPAEAIAFLGHIPVFADVNADNYNIDVSKLEGLLTTKTKAVIAVHLFGHPADLKGLKEFCDKHKLFLIEDNAQSLGSRIIYNDHWVNAGTIGHLSTTSFFPSKNLGCMGDGGAIFTRDEHLARKITLIVNHGQQVKYQHEIVGINSRLDTIQAAVLNVKLKYLDIYNQKRRSAATLYHNLLKEYDIIKRPAESSEVYHVYNQFTIKINSSVRRTIVNAFQEYKIPFMIYYPSPLHHQKAFEGIFLRGKSLPVTETLCQEVLSLPIHTEITEEQIRYICTTLTRSLESVNTTLI